MLDDTRGFTEMYQHSSTLSFWRFDSRLYCYVNPIWILYESYLPNTPRWVWNMSIFFVAKLCRTSKPTCLWGVFDVKIFRQSHVKMPYKMLDQDMPLSAVLVGSLVRRCGLVGVVSLIISFLKPTSPLLMVNIYCPGNFPLYNILLISHEQSHSNSSFFNIPQYFIPV